MTLDIDEDEKTIVWISRPKEPQDVGLRLHRRSDGIDIEEVDLKGDVVSSNYVGLLEVRPFIKGLKYLRGLTNEEES